MSIERIMVLPMVKYRIFRFKRCVPHLQYLWFYAGKRRGRLKFYLGFKWRTLVHRTSVLPFMITQEALDDLQEALEDLDV